MTTTISTRSLLPVSLLSLGFAACAPDAAAPDPVSEAPLQIHAHDDHTLQGTFDAGDLVVAFVADSPRALYGAVTVTVGEHALTLTADAATGEIAFDAGAARLAADQLGALESLSLALDDYLGDPDDVGAMHESLLVAASRYFAVAPVDTELAATYRVVEGLETSLGTGNDGKSCIRIGEVRTATYDGSAGVTSESWTVGAHGGVQWNGDYACMGRCGAGCGSYDWTLDCLEHDACSRRYYSSSGAVDHNCGDEWSEASDDYTAFWKRCRS